jgi:hypothetical protein
MRALLRRTVTGVSLLTLAACAPAASPPVAPAQPVASPTPAFVAQPDLSPVREPAGVVLLARLRNVRDSLSAAERMVRVPISLENELRDALREEDADVFKLDASVDLALGLDPASTDTEPRFQGAISIPVLDLEGARVQLERHREVVQLLPGVYRAKVVARDDEVVEQGTEEGVERQIEELPLGKELPKETFCDLAASVGDAPARLVCSDGEKELDALRPWLTRGLPREPSANADFEVKASFTPLRDRYVSVARAQAAGAGLLARQWLETSLQIREPRLLALPDLVLGETIAFFDDLDHLTVSGDLVPDASEISFRGKVAFRARSSWLTRVYTDANGEAGAPPEAFWRLPRDVDSASYARSADPKLYEGFNDTVRLLVSDLLTQTPLSAGSKSAIDGFLASMPMQKAAVVTARGSAGQRIPVPTGKRKTTPRDAVRDFERTVHSAVGWSVVGVEGPSAPYAEWFKKGLDAYDRLVQDARNDPDLGPEVRAAKWVPRARWRSPLPGYPRGSAGLEVTVRFDSKDIWDVTVGKEADAPSHPAGAAVPGTVTLHWVVVPDGANRTWIGLSTDTKLLQEKLRVAVTGRERDTLASLPGLEALRATPTVAGGFMSYGAVLDEVTKALEGKGSEVDPAVVQKVLGAMPNGLRTPMLLLHTATAGQAPSNEIELRVQRGTVEDLASLVQFALSREGMQLIEDLGKGDDQTDAP